MSYTASMHLTGAAFVAVSLAVAAYILLNVGPLP
jgi:hypothetical protein